MRTLEDATDAAERKVVEDVRDHGWHVALIPDDEDGPGFAFTVGLSATFAHPELFIVGLPSPVMRAILDQIAGDVRDGRKFTAGDQSADALEGYSVSFLSIERGEFSEWLGLAIWYHRSREFDALQVVWPDKGQRFPWQQGASPAFVQRQRLLGPAPG